MSLRAGLRKPPWAGKEKIPSSTLLLYSWAATQKIKTFKSNGITRIWSLRLPLPLLEFVVFNTLETSEVWSGCCKANKKPFKVSFKKHFHCVKSSMLRWPFDDQPFFCQSWTLMRLIITFRAIDAHLVTAKRRLSLDFPRLSNIIVRAWSASLKICLGLKRASDQARSFLGPYTGR